jgi:tetratricopeptide (TPR) repeat protein
MGDDNLAQALQSHRLGNLQQAQALYRQILQSDPRQSKAWYGLGVIAYQTGQFPLAASLLNRALALDPQDPEAHNTKAVVHRALGQIDAAISHLQRALSCNPRYAEAHNNLANLLQDQGDLETAIAHYRQALQINPRYAEAYSNLGNALQDQGNWDEAVKCYQQAIAYNPRSAAAHCSLGYVLREQGELQQAKHHLEQAVILQPDLPQAHWNLAYYQLLVGDLQRGFRHYEWRWKLQGFSPRNFTQPLWDGSDLQGKTILLHHEQGLGDTIQFIRYASLVKQRGGQVLAWVQPALARLLASVPGVDQIVAEDPLPNFDVQAPLLSLPYLLKTTMDQIPATVPYLSVPHCQTEVEPDRSAGLRVGLVWASGYRASPHAFNGYASYQKRSCSLDSLAELLTLSGIRWFSLQVDHHADQIQSLGVESLMEDCRDRIGDFADTARVMLGLDLIVSVDTATAHLAGALAKPVWVLLPFAPDWRWLLDRSDTPWYPTMRLFRQRQRGDWSSVIAELRQALQAEVDRRA